jgi:predicted nucleic acid-binding protein
MAAANLIFIKRSDCADSGESQFACGKGGGGDANDMLIAAHARALDAVCVTDNTAEFKRVPALKVENWLN